jgi:hypothetical protein
MSRARNTSPTGKVRDWAHRSNSRFSSEVKVSKFRLSIMPYKRMKHAYVMGLHASGDAGMSEGLYRGCAKQGLRSRPLLSASSPLKPKINRGLTLKLVQRTGALHLNL